MTDHVYEAAYSDALTLVAVGETRDETRGQLLDGYPTLTGDAASDILADALHDALRQGIEREDIDPSWF